MQSTDIAAEILRNLTPLSAFRSRLTNKTTVSGWKEHKLLEKHRDAVASYQVLSVDTLLVQSAKTGDVDLCQFALARDAVTWQKAFYTAIQHGNVDIAEAIRVRAQKAGGVYLYLPWAVSSNNVTSFKYVFGIMKDVVFTSSCYQRRSNSALMLEYALDHGIIITKNCAVFAFSCGVRARSEKIMAAARAAGAPEKSVEYFYAACETCDVEYAKQWKSDGHIDFSRLIYAIIRDKQHHYTKLHDMLRYLRSIGAPLHPTAEAFLISGPMDMGKINKEVIESGMMYAAFANPNLAVLKRCLELDAKVGKQEIIVFLESELAKTDDAAEALQLLLEKLPKAMLDMHGTEFLYWAVVRSTRPELLLPFLQYYDMQYFMDAIFSFQGKWSQVELLCDYLREHGREWIWFAPATEEVPALEYIAKYLPPSSALSYFDRMNSKDADVIRWIERFRRRHPTQSCFAAVGL